MSKKTAPKTSQCPISLALDMFGDRWSLLIIRDIVFKDKRLYGDFVRSPEKISTNILADRLSKLETNGILEKGTDPSHGARSIYSLTPKGKDLIPILLEMTAWSAKHYVQENVSDNIIQGAPRHLLQRLEQDRVALIAEIADNIGS